MHVEGEVDDGDKLEEAEAVEDEVEPQLAIDQARGNQRLHSHRNHHRQQCQAHRTLVDNNLADIDVHAGSLGCLVNNHKGAKTEEDELRLVYVDVVAGDNEEDTHNEMSADENGTAGEDGDGIIRNDGTKEARKADEVGILL